MVTAMGTSLALVLLLATLGGIHGSETAFSLFFNEIRACLLDQQIPPVAHSDETVKVILAASQNETGFVRVMECVNRKVMAYSTSASPSHAFVKMMFGTDGQLQKLMTLAHRAHTLYQITPRADFSCIAKEASMPNMFDYCLTYQDSEYGITQSINDSCSDYGQYRMTKSCLETESLYSKQCSYGVSEMVAVFADVLFTKCNETASLFNNVTLPPYTSSYPVHHSSFDWMHSAFVTCGEVAYPNAPLQLMHLFPPSEFSYMTIQRDTKQKFKQELINALSQFCSNVSVYSECVTQKITDGKTFTDSVLRMFIDGNNFGNTMAKYCQNQNLVTSQFDCMVDSVNKTQCNGGILDILQFIFQIPMEQLMGFAYSCSDIYKRKQCRIDKQLSVCEPQFAALMEETMNNLLTSDCRKGDYVSRSSSQTEIMGCMAEYYIGWSSRILSQPETFKDPSLIADFVVTEMGHFCAAYDGMLDCIEEKIKTSEKTGDVILRKYAPIKSIRGLLKYLCGKKEVIKNNLRCLMLEIGSMASKNESCLKTHAEEYVNTMGQFSNITGVDDQNIKKIKEAACPMTKKFGACFKPSFDKCSAEAGDMLDTLVDYFYNSCMDPNYEIKSESQTGGGNSAGQLLPVLSTIFMTLLVAL